MVDTEKRIGKEMTRMISKTQEKLDRLEAKQIMYSLIEIVLRIYKKRPSEFLETRLREMKQCYENLK